MAGTSVYYASSTEDRPSHVKNYRVLHLICTQITFSVYNDDCNNG
jgi:hypothetical protein